MSDLFTFDRVTVHRDGTPVLHDVSVRLPDGGVTALVGPSGSGKSTLLRCCNRLEHASTGTVSFRGRDVRTLDPLAHRRAVGMVFQTPTLFPGSVLDNLRAAAPRLERADAAALLGRVALAGGLLDRIADTLSGGEAQRLCLARALAAEPEAILADESTSSLDADATAALETLVRRLADEGTPVVWVTHDRDQVRRLADHVIALEAGRIVEAPS